MILYWKEDHACAVVVQIGGICFRILHRNGVCRRATRCARYAHWCASAQQAGSRLPQAVFNDGTPVDPARTVLSALLLQVFDGVRSERQLMEQLDYNLLYR
jgi:hypothetical protein